MWVVHSMLSTIYDLQNTTRRRLDALNADDASQLIFERTYPCCPAPQALSVAETTLHINEALCALEYRTLTPPLKHQRVRVHHTI